MTVVKSLRCAARAAAMSTGLLLAGVPVIGMAQANVPFAESFDAATTATFLTAGYRPLPGDATKPLYFATGGGSNITITPEGRLSLTNGRFTIGNTDTTVTTTSTVSPPGIFDLSQQYTVSFCLASASGSGNFQIYVNNNTTGSANSPLGGASRIANLAVTGLSAGTAYSVTSTVGTPTAFLQLRSESAALVVIDNLRIDYGASGSATCPPPGQAQLTLDPPDASWTTPAGGAARAVAVTAITAAGNPDTFGVVSSNPAAVDVAVTANVATLTPLAAGTSTITFTSGSDPTVQKTIAATVLAPSTTVYDLNGVAEPAALASNVHADTRLRLQFDAAPALGTAGAVRIERVSDGAIIDTIPLAGDTDALGHPGQDRVRVIKRDAIAVSGNAVTIAPHSHALAYDTEYRVLVDNGVITGATLNGTPFDGMGPNAGWRFTTRSAPAASANLVVDDDGPADFRTVQGAIDFAVQQFPGDDPVSVMIGNGDYRELLYLRGKNNLSLVGETRDGVVVQYRNSEAINAGTGTSRAPGPGAANGGRSVFLIENADLLTLENLTVRNTTLRSASPSQAETLYFNGDGTHRLIAKYARFQSEQDTLQLKSYAWIYRSLVEGNVDFIWGANRVSLFEESEIRSVGDTFNPSQGGYVLQARSVAADDKGFVFLNSALTHGTGPGPLAGDVPPGTTYLARSGGSAAYFDNVVFINTRMDAHVATVGWASAGINGQPAPNPAVPTATSGWREYGTTDLSGTPVNLASRIGGYLLQPAEVAAEFSTRAQIFSAYGGGIGWDPLDDGPADRLFANGFEAQGGPLLPLLAENFDEATAGAGSGGSISNFWSAAYRAIPGQSDTPMYTATGGGSGLLVTNEKTLSMTGARFTIGNTIPAQLTSAAGAPPGAFDLSLPYTISFCVVSRSDSGFFYVYIDNNTTTSANSPLGAASRLGEFPVADMVPGTVYSVTGNVGTASDSETYTSFGPDR